MYSVISVSDLFSKLCRLIVIILPLGKIIGMEMLMSSRKSTRPRTRRRLKSIVPLSMGAAFKPSTMTFSIRVLTVILSLPVRPWFNFLYSFMKSVTSAS